MRIADASAARNFSPRIPLAVVGALKSGGSGKTSVAAELARELAARGARPALLVYRIGKGKAAESAPGIIEVRGDSDWRDSSEEAVLLARETGLRVFATRNRAAAWRRLHDAGFQTAGAFDFLVSDDGFQDPRLRGALRLLLTAPGESPGIFNLLPGGPFRETRGAAARADLRLEGPLPSGPIVTSQLPKAGGAGRPLFPFRRRVIPPPGFDLRRPWIAYCALGDNLPFLSDLARLGVDPVAVITGRNHSAPPLKKLQAALAARPGSALLCTRKDFLKLEAEAAGLPLYCLDQAIALDPEITAAVMAYRLLFRDGYLVHYPG